MKALYAVVLLSSLAFARDNSTAPAVAPGCGAEKTKFDVDTNKTQHPISKPDAGKALVYFVEDDSQFGSFPKPTTRAGVDGQWVGATHGNSYLYFAVDPGEHHLCASWQSAVIVGQGHKAAAAHFTAAAGEVYFFKVKNTWWKDLGNAGIDLKPLDSDEGQLLASKFSFSTSHEKK